MKILVVMNSSKVKLGGGIIQVILNYRDQLVGGPIEYSFAINIENDNELIDKLTCHGENYYYLPDKKKSLIKYMISLYNVCNKKNFDAIHIHGNSATMIIELLIASICGIKIRIVHCHNSKCEHPYLNKILKPVFKHLYTKAVACSEIAGEWIFGKNNFAILHNAIDLNLFHFSEDKRHEIRNKLNISDDTLVVGHVGNFNEQKNQEFLIKIFYNLQIRYKTALILLGTGNLEEKIKEMVMSYTIEDKVFFIGMRTDVYNWMFAMDIFVFPSKWEGLGMVAIEAQACGLSVLASDQVPISVKIGDVHFLSLDASIEEWSTAIIKISHNKHKRLINASDFIDYDIRKEKNRLLDLYMK